MLKIAIIVYVAMSVIITLNTISRWYVIDRDLDSIPAGDREFYTFSKYSIANIIFLPSIILCEIYGIIVKIINFIINL